MRNSFNFKKKQQQQLQVRLVKILKDELMLFVIHSSLFLVFLFEVPPELRAVKHSLLLFVYVCFA